MHKPKIFLSKVTNLSDARYFAAAGVDFMSFSLDGDITESAISEIVSWVEGPIFVGELSMDHDTEYINYLIEKLKLSYVLNSNSLSKFNVQNIVKTIFPNEASLGLSEILYSKISIEELANISTTLLSKTIIETEFSNNDLVEIIEKYGPYGLAIQGGDEEKVGFKSYEDWDEFFEILEQI